MTRRPPGQPDPRLRVAGDVTARYRRWCAELAEPPPRSMTARPSGRGRTEPLDGMRRRRRRCSTVLPRLLEGAELAAARLIIASLDPDLDDLPALAAAGHGH